jgi:hypothetical protein
MNNCGGKSTKKYELVKNYKENLKFFEKNDYFFQINCKNIINYMWAIITNNFWEKKKKIFF